MVTTLQLADARGKKSLILAGILACSVVGVTLVAYAVVRLWLIGRMLDSVNLAEKDVTLNDLLSQAPLGGRLLFESVVLIVCVVFSVATIAIICSIVVSLTTVLIRLWSGAWAILPNSAELPNLPRVLWILSHVLSDRTRIMVFTPAYLDIVFAHEQKILAPSDGEWKLWNIVLRIRTVTLIIECLVSGVLEPMRKLIASILKQHK